MILDYLQILGKFFSCCSSLHAVLASAFEQFWWIHFCDSLIVIYISLRVQDLVTSIMV